MWDIEPWDNDSAADWFPELITSEFIDKVEAALRLDEDSAEEIRAAAYVVRMLGLIYIWDVERLPGTLKLAVDGLNVVLESEEFQEWPELIERVTAERDDLADRLKQISPDK